MGNCSSSTDDDVAPAAHQPAPQSSPPQEQSQNKHHYIPPTKQQNFLPEQPSSKPKKVQSKSPASSPASSSPKRELRSKEEEEIRNKPVYELKKELRDRDVPMVGLVEKDDLVEALMEARKKDDSKNVTSNYHDDGDDNDDEPAPKPSPFGATLKPTRAQSGTKGKPFRKTEGKAAKSAALPKEARRKHEYYEQPVNPDRYKCEEFRFGGGSQYNSIGKQEQVQGSIKQGVAELKKNPGKYTAMIYQADMTDRPEDRQKYTLIHSEGTENYIPLKISPKGHFTLHRIRYERCTPMDSLPMNCRDEYTDTVLSTYQGKKLGTVIPGRGMGVGDAPGLKIIGDVDPSDIKQGSVGDCWLLSAISALGEFDGAVTRLFRKTPNLDYLPSDKPTKYTVSLYDLRTWKEVDIVVDERLCTKTKGENHLLAAGLSEDYELWVCYLEKAIAAHCGGWDKIKGGQCTHAWALLTGCRYQYTIQLNPATGKYGCFARCHPTTGKWADHTNSPHDSDASIWPVGWPTVGGGGVGEIDSESLFERMCAWDDENYIVGASVPGTSDSKQTGGLVHNHAYSVISAHNDVAGTPIDLLKVRNPWGRGEMEDGEFDDDGPGWDKYPQIKAELNPVDADDGIFYITKQEFFHYFTTVYLSASNMTEFLED